MEKNGKPANLATVECEGRQVPYHIVCSHLLTSPQIWIATPPIQWEGGPARGVGNDYLCANRVLAAAYGHILPITDAWHFVCSECFRDEYDDYPLGVGTAEAEDYFCGDLFPIFVPYRWVDLVWADG